MARTKHAFHILNKRELLHLMDSGVHDLAGFKRTAKSQAMDRKVNSIRAGDQSPAGNVGRLPRNSIYL